MEEVLEVVQKLRRSLTLRCSESGVGRCGERGRG